MIGTDLELYSKSVPIINKQLTNYILISSIYMLTLIVFTVVSDMQSDI